jgi:predicted Zn finger-like uncharacterized protein
MILTCPKCATRYFVDDGQLASGPREVECDQCGAIWTASAEGSPETAAEPATPLFAQPRGRTPKEARRSLWPWSRR